MSRAALAALRARLPSRYDGDLRLVLWGTALAVLLTVLPLPDPLRTPVLLPFALLGAGYALTALLFPPGFVSRDERVVLTVAFGISVSALGGLVVQAVGLDRWTWLALLAVASVLAAVAAQARRGATAARHERRPGSPPALTRATTVPLLLAVALAALAVSVASSGAEDQLARSRFTSVWLVPVDAATAVPGAPLELGVANHEGEDAVYEVRLVRSGATLRSWRFRLDDGEQWAQALTAPAAQPGRPLVAALTRRGGLYRRVALEVESR